MKRSLWKRGSVLAACALAMTAFATPSSAASSRGRSVIAHDVATTTAAAREVAAYWTPARMLRAIPLDNMLVNLPRRLTTVAKGQATTLLPTLPRLPLGPLAFPTGGGPWSAGGAVTQTAGRVFFSFQGGQASCSGNAVTSGNRSVVLTAGHCVKLDGVWHTNWVFVPGYHNGIAPFGTWTASQTLSTPQWVATEDVNFDVGAAVVNPLGGTRLTDAVGGQGVAFNQPRGQEMYSFGYPAAAPYDGSALIYCSSTAFDDLLLSNDLGLGCDMTGGSSGGPWFLSFNEATGTGVQNSVNSFKYSLFPGWMFGPYFGTDAQNLYHAAAASTRFALS